MNIEKYHKVMMEFQMLISRVIESNKTVIYLDQKKISCLISRKYKSTNNPIKF